MEINWLQKERMMMVMVEVEEEITPRRKDKG
jgi:hypothetical protein